MIQICKLRAAKYSSFSLLVILAYRISSKNEQFHVSWNVCKLSHLCKHVFCIKMAYSFTYLYKLKTVLPLCIRYTYTSSTSSCFIILKVKKYTPEKVTKYNVCFIEGGSHVTDLCFLLRKRKS